jgi:PPOX class probable F420-dependent enzyme
MTDAQVDEFLADRRYGILTTLRSNGAPVSIPIWYEWERPTLRMFAHQASGKLRRITRDARATVVVVNHPDEPENWVAFDGCITVHQDGGLEMAERVFDRYYPPGDERRSELESWRKMKDQWRLLELTPDAIRVLKD